MSGEAQAQGTPAEPWKDWQEAWGADPFRPPDPGEMSKQWLNAAIRSWPRSAEMVASGFPDHWQQLVEEACAAMQAGSDPQQQFFLLKQWYDANSEGWSKVFAAVIGTEQFAEVMSRWLESHTSFAGMFRRASEQYFSTLQLATRSDIARVAGLVVKLEEKVDRIEDIFIDVEDGTSSLATGTAISKLEERLGSVERKLERVLASLEKIEAIGQAQAGSSPGNDRARG
jgi:polyhydroxyalkanoic acid synthase PhaR subunit